MFRQDLLPFKNRLIDIFLVINVIISYDNFIAIDPMKKFGGRLSFSDFHGQKNLTGNKNPVLGIMINI